MAQFFFYPSIVSGFADRYFSRFSTERQWQWCERYFFTSSSWHALQTLVSLVYFSSPSARCRHSLVLVIRAADSEQQILEKWVSLAAWPKETVPKTPCARVKTLEQNVTKCKVCCTSVRDFRPTLVFLSFFILLKSCMNPMGLVLQF